jgi:hypothetical protein
MSRQRKNKVERDVVWTPRLGVTLETLKEWIVEFGMAPSLDELGYKLGVSRISAYGRLLDLDKLGLIDYSARNTRGLKIVAKDVRELLITG